MQRYIVERVGDEWVLRRRLSVRPMMSAPSRQEVIAYARELLKDKGAAINVFSADGSFEQVRIDKSE